MGRTAPCLDYFFCALPNNPPAIFFAHELAWPAAPATPPNIPERNPLPDAFEIFGPKNEIEVIAFQQDAKGLWTAVLRVGDSAPFDAAQGDALIVM